MKIGVAQIQCSLGHAEENFQLISNLVKQAKDAEAVAVFFPELSDLGYDMDVVHDKAHKWSDPFVANLKQLALDSGIYICSGVSEKSFKGVYNSICVISPEGYFISSYRKTHLFGYKDVNEKDVFLEGNDIGVVEIAGVKFGLSLCFDLRFPEMFRTLREKGAEVLVNLSAWPKVRATQLDVLIKARAIENQCYFIEANRVGCDNNLEFAGNSCVLDALGEKIIDLKQDENTIQFCDLDLYKLKQFRENFNLWERRRTDLYIS